MEKNHQKHAIKVILLLLIINLSFAVVSATQCNDGLDNDGDNKIDVLVEVNAPTGSETKTWTKDPLGIRTFVNSKATEYDFTPVQATDPSQSALHYDYITADFVCELAGYDTVESMGHVSNYDWGRSGWFSCYDNQLSRWNPLTDDFLSTQACIMGNMWLSSLTCKDKIVNSECNDGIDNDGDGKTDLNDDGCDSILDNSEIQDDPDCESPSDDDESTPECTINSDCSSQNYNSENFCDQNTVYYNAYTYGCSSGNCEEDITRVDVENCPNGCSNGQCLNQELTECEDNEDNDNDGLTDEDDPGCWDDPSDSSTYNPNLDDESRYDVECDGSEGCCGAEIEGELICDGKNILQRILQKLCQNSNTGTSFCDSIPTFIRWDNIDSCDYGCDSGECYGECNVDSECQEILSQTYCSNDDVYEETHEPSCDDYTCGDTPTIEKTAECGESGYQDITETYCIGDSIYFNQTFYTNGCSSSECFSIPGLEEAIKEGPTCSDGCSNGQCNNYIDENGPEVNLTNPDNATIILEGEIKFNYTAIDESTIKNCSLIINDNTELFSNIITGANTFNFTPNQTSTNYKWEIVCFDIFNNKGESETRNFFLAECVQDSNCGTESEDLICQGDDIFKEITTPLCQNNSCAQDSTYEFIKECKDGCLNGHCESDRKKKSDDDTPIIVNRSPLIQLLNFSEPSSLILGNAVLGDKKANTNWWFIWLLILLAGIILLLLLIFYTVLR